MGSRNAFRDATSNTSSVPAIESGEHVKNRQKLAMLEATIHTKIADPVLALEVDHMVLDYVAYQAIAATFSVRQLQHLEGISFEHNATMTDNFLAIFKAKYPSFQPDAELRFRLLLLKFSLLFVRRLQRDLTAPTPSALAALRRRNHERAMTWIGSMERMPSMKYDTTVFDSELPIPQEILDRNRAHVLDALGAPAEDEAYEDPFYGTSNNIALLDILPTFMAISAARNAISSSNLTTQWMHLAGEFMLQACLEQYLVRGSSGSDAIDEAFAWGYQPHNAEGGEDAASHSKNGLHSGADGPTNHLPQEKEVGNMFEAEDSVSEVPGWAEVKFHYLHKIIPHSGVGLSIHLETVASKLSIQAFERSVMNFLKALSASMPAPILVQLEKGILDEMNAEDTKRFLSDCGLPSQWPLD